MRPIIVIWITIVLIISSFIFIAIPETEGSTQEKFSDSSTEKSVSLISSWPNKEIKFELPNRATVTEARLNVTGMKDNSNIFPAGVRIDVGDDGTNEWEFDGNGFSGLGKQDRFGDDSTTKDYEFLNGGFNNRETILLPKNATVTSTNMTMEGKMYGKNGNARVPPIGLAFGNTG